MNKIGRIAAITVVAPLLAFGPTERTAPAHWALIVGISDYVHFDDVEGGDLPGAENDARGVRNVLMAKYGVPEENIRMLLSREATRSGIQEGIQWLQRSARPGDNVVVYVSGHGSQVWDENGDEEDGLDETIAPADVDPQSAVNDIVDDDMGEWLLAIPVQGNIVYVHDNCNAGTGTRAATPFSRARRLGRDVASLERPATASRRALPGQDEDDRSGFDIESGKILELAAAQPHQAAVDAYFAGEGGAEAFHGGAFTTYLLRELWRAPADATYEEVFQQVARSLKQNRFQQDPYLSTEVQLAKAPFLFVQGGAAGQGAAMVPVVSSAGGSVQLGAGAALGLTRGSILETEGGARMRVEAVARDGATARALTGTPSAGERARIVGYVYPRPRLRVSVAGVDSESAAALKAALGGSDAVELVEQENAFAHLMVRRRGTELQVLGQDGFVRHRSPSGDGAGALVGPLLKEAASMRLSEMDNPASPFGVEVWLGDGRTTYGLGERLSFQARSDRAGYLTLVDLGTDGTVAVLFPNGHDKDNRIAAGGTVRFPTESELEAQPPVGRGMLRAFVTERPLELPIPDGDYLYGGPEVADVVMKALREAAGTAGSSDAVLLDGWGTTSVVYEITN